MIGNFIGFTFFFIFTLPFELGVSAFLILPLWIITFFATYGSVISTLLYIIAKVFNKLRLKRYSIISFYCSILCFSVVMLLMTIRQLSKNAGGERGKLMVEKYYWMYSNFKTGDKYDLTEGGKNPEMEYASNFNYGVMGKAAGLSDLELQLAAGMYQIWSGTSNISFYNTYFDDPVDQKYIKEGIDWYNINDKKSHYEK